MEKVRRYALWMRPCAVETVPGVGSAVTAQLTQTCRLWTTASVQRQVIVVQDWKVTDETLHLWAINLNSPTPTTGWAHKLQCTTI